MGEPFIIQSLDNGMVLLAERIEGVSSAAMSLLLPYGAARDPDDAAGAAAVAAEWCMRGAAGMDTRRLNDALDALGCRHDEAIQSEHLVLSAAMLARNLIDVLELYADIVRRARLEDRTFEPCRSLVLQDLAALEDEPATKCNVLLAEQFYPHPFGRCNYGCEQSLRTLTPQTVRRGIEQRFCPQGAILAVAGNIDPHRLEDAFERLFADWQGPASEPIKTNPPPRGMRHVRKDSAQAHIGIAYPAVTPADPQYYAARVAEAILSWGMGCRLFAEVREKRGLVYHVSCHYHALKDHAGMFAYAGTRPQVAQQTLQVTVEQLRSLAEGIEPEELDRAKTQLTSALVMQGESTRARARALASDYYHLARLRSLDEIARAIDAVEADDVLEYVHDHPARDLTILVIGPEPLDVTGLT